MRRDVLLNDLESCVIVSLSTPENVNIIISVKQIILKKFRSLGTNGYHIMYALNSLSSQDQGTYKKKRWIDDIITQIPEQEEF